MHCPTWVLGARVVFATPESATTTTTMKLLHLDITGPFPTSIGGARHLLAIYEDSSGLMMGVPIRAKSEVGRVLTSKIPELERRSGGRLKRIRFDGAKEFTTGNLLNWDQEAGEGDRP